MGMAHGLEGKTVTGLGENTESQQNEQRTDFGHQKIEIPGPPVRRVLMLVSDQKIARERHQFPGNQKQECIVCHEYEQHAGHKQTGKEPQDRKGLRTMLILAHVCGPVKSHGQDHDPGHGHEKARQGIETQMPGEPRQTQAQLRGIDLAGKHIQNARSHRADAGCAKQHERSGPEYDGVAISRQRDQCRQQS